MISDIFDKNVIKILTFLSISPGSKFHRKEIKDKVAMNNVPLDKALNTLVNTGLLKQEKRLYCINFENKYSKGILEIIKGEYSRLNEIPLKAYFALRDVSASLSSLNEIGNAYLFGSYAKLIYTDSSDIDLAIFLAEESPGIKKTIDRIIGKIERKYNKKIEVHFFNKKDSKSRDPLVKEILRNSVVLI